MAVFVVFITTYMLILPAITLTVDSLSPTLDLTKITYDKATYNGTEYTADLIAYFSEPSDVNSSTTYYVVLPDGVSLTNYSGSTLTGTATINGNEVDAFTYTYEYDDNGVLYAKINFLDSYLDYLEQTGATIEEGWLSFNATIDSSNEDADDNLVLTNGTVTWTIAATDITSTDTTSNPNGDLNVSKSSSGYNKTTNSITYTITISSDKGTVSDISIEDIIKAGNLTVKSVGDYTITLYYLDEWGQTSVQSASSDLITDSSYDSTTGELNMTLAALTDGAGYGSKYVVTYTVYFDDITDYSISETVSNSITASADTGWEGNGNSTVTDTSEKNVTVSYDLLSKTGTADSEGNITWTITINADGLNIYGMTLTDEMFEQFYDWELAKLITGGSQGDDYEFILDSNRKVTGIKFIDTSGTTNTNTYTITYTTSATSTWASGSQKVTNTATLSGDGLGSDVTSTKEVYVNSGGVSKSCDRSELSIGGDYVYLTWTTTGTIPSGGIESGTKLYDYLGGNSYATQSTQWFTYDQITSDSAKNTWYTISLSDNTTLNYNSQYTLTFYCKDTGTWVSLQDLLSYESTYKDCKFTAFCIEFINDVTVSSSATFSWTYTTTADRSSVDGSSVTSLTYTNEAKVIGESELSATAYHTEYAYVTKTDGNGKTGTSTTTIDKNGTLVWIVKAYVPAGSTTTSYTITDTLPKNVTLTSAVVTISNESCTLPDAANSYSGTINGGTVSGTVTTDSDGIQTVTITVSSEAYEKLITSGGYITVTYTCQLADSILSTLTQGSSAGTYANSVKVTTLTDGVTDPVTLGEATQSQEVTYSADVVSKDFDWSSDTSTLSYTVVINPEAATLANGENLYFEDILTVNLADTWGQSAQLVSGSVKFYEAVSDGSGGYTKGDLLDIAWTYTQTSVDMGGSYIQAIHTIASDSIPDGTAIILEYQYQVWMPSYSGTSTYLGTSMNNTFTLNGQYKDTSGTTSSETYTDNHYDAGVGASGNSYTLVKAETGNYSIVLSGAVYYLYRWNASDEVWEVVGRYTTGTDGTVVINKTVLDSYYVEDTAYKLVEIEAPSGYVLDDSTEYYFYWSKTGTISAPSGWDSTSATDLSQTSNTVYAANDAIPYIGVEKVWLDSEGNEITEGLSDSITVELHRLKSTSADYPTSGTASEDTSFTIQEITLNADNDWSYKVYDLDASEEVSGTTWYYYYYFVETEVSGELASVNYTVTYSDNNSAIVPGKTVVTVTNQEKEDRTYVDIDTKKSWKYLEDNGITTSSKIVPNTATEEVTLVLLRQASSTNTSAAYSPEVAGSITLDGTVDENELSAWVASWTNLLYTYTDYAGYTVTYTYYIAEICGTDSGVQKVEFSNTNTSLDLEAVQLTVDGVTYEAYKIVMANEPTANTNGDAAATVTNYLYQPDKKVISATKSWQNYDGTTADAPDDASVVLQLYFTDGSTSYKAGGYFDSNGVYQYVEGSDSAKIYQVTLDGKTTSETTTTDAAGDSITVKINGWSVTWSGLDGSYEYYIVETSAASGGVALSTGTDGYTTYYSVDDGSTVSTDASEYAGDAEVAASSASGNDPVFTVINRKNTGTTEITVNKIFAGSTTPTEYIYFKLYQVAETTITYTDGTEPSVTTSVIQYTDGSVNDSGYYAVSSAENWTLTLSGLPSGTRTVDTSSGTVTEVVYSYYLVETGAGDDINNISTDAENLSSYYIASYTAGDGTSTSATELTLSDNTTVTAYSVSDGTITIRNVDKDAELLVEKVWTDQDGNVITDPDSSASVTVDVYKVATHTEYTGDYYTLTIYYGDSTYEQEKLVKANTEVTIVLPSSNHSYYVNVNGGTVLQDWSAQISTITIPADNVTGKIDVHYYYGSGGTCTVTYDGESTDTGIQEVSESTLLDEGRELSSQNAWSYYWSGLKLSEDIGGTEYTYTYYVVETSASYNGQTLTSSVPIVVTYASDGSTTSTIGTTTIPATNGVDTLEAYGTGVTSGELTTVTITNEVEEDKTTSVSVTKTWSSSIDSASVTFTLIQLLVNPNATSDNDKWVTDGTTGDVVVNASGTEIASYTQTIDVTNGGAEIATWMDLPTKATYDNVTYECAYFVVESKITNAAGGTGTDITSQYEAAYTISSGQTTPATYTDENGIVYYQVTSDNPLTVTNTSQTGVELPSTGGLGADHIMVLFGCGLAMFVMAIILARRKYLMRGGGA